MEPKKFVDAHCHLTEKEVLGKVDEVISKCRESGVVAMICNSLDYPSAKTTLELQDKYREVFAAIGTHPCTVRKDSGDHKRVLSLIKENKGKIIAIGEIGLDYKILANNDEKNFQINVFKEFVEEAKKLSIPVVVHSRDAQRDAVNLLVEWGCKKVLLHWFSGSIDVLKVALDQGYYVSVTPAIRYDLRVINVAKETPLEYLLVESDSPVAYRGRIAYPYDVVEVGNELAKLKNISLEKISEQLIENAKHLFNLPL